MEVRALAFWFVGLASAPSRTCSSLLDRLLCSQLYRLLQSAPALLLLPPSLFITYLLFFFHGTIVERCTIVLGHVQTWSAVQRRESPQLSVRHCAELRIAARLQRAFAGRRTKLSIATTPPLLVQSCHGQRTTLGSLSFWTRIRTGGGVGQLIETY